MIAHALYLSHDGVTAWRQSRVSVFVLPTRDDHLIFSAFLTEEFMRVNHGASVIPVLESLSMQVFGVNFIDMPENSPIVSLTESDHLISSDQK